MSSKPPATGTVALPTTTSRSSSPSSSVSQLTSSFSSISTGQPVASPSQSTTIPLVISQPISPVSPVATHLPSLIPTIPSAPPPPHSNANGSTHTDPANSGEKTLAIVIPVVSVVSGFILFFLLYRFAVFCCGRRQRDVAPLPPIRTPAMLQRQIILDTSSPTSVGPLLAPSTFSSPDHSRQGSSRTSSIRRSPLSSTNEQAQFPPMPSGSSIVTPTPPSDEVEFGARPSLQRRPRPVSFTPSTTSRHSFHTSASARQSFRGPPHAPHMRVEIVLPKPLAPKLYPYRPQQAVTESRIEHWHHDMALRQLAISHEDYRGLPSVSRVRRPLEHVHRRARSFTPNDFDAYPAWSILPPSHHSTVPESPPPVPLIPPHLTTHQSASITTSQSASITTSQSSTLSPSATACSLPPSPLSNNDASPTSPAEGLTSDIMDLRPPERGGDHSHSIHS